MFVSVTISPYVCADFTNVFTSVAICSDGDTYSADRIVLFEICTVSLYLFKFPILVLRARFWVLIVPIPGHCLPFLLMA